MTSWLTVHSEVDPGDLGVNLRFNGNQVIHPRARKAQELLIKDVKRAVEKHGDTFNPEYGVAGVTFAFTSSRFDIDGPIKRTLDAVERGIKTSGHTWNDSRIIELYVSKIVRETPGITITLR